MQNGINNWNVETYRNKYKYTYYDNKLLTCDKLRKKYTSKVQSNLWPEMAIWNLKWMLYDLVEAYNYHFLKQSRIMHFYASDHNIYLLQRAVSS